MSKEAMNLALEALQFALHVGFDESSESQIKKGDKAVQQHQKAITALREALAKPDFWEGYVPEPVKHRGEATLAQQEPVEHCEAGPEFCPVCNKELNPDPAIYPEEAYEMGLEKIAFYTSPPSLSLAQRTWEEWFKWWRTSKVADSTEAEIDFADFMLIVRAVEAEYGIKENT